MLRKSLRRATKSMTVEDLMRAVELGLEIEKLGLRVYFGGGRQSLRSRVEKATKIASKGLDAMKPAKRGSPETYTKLQKAQKANWRAARKLAKEKGISVLEARHDLAVSKGTV